MKLSSSVRVVDNCLSNKLYNPCKLKYITGKIFNEITTETFLSERLCYTKK